MSDAGLNATGWSNVPEQASELTSTVGPREKRVVLYVWDLLLVPALLGRWENLTVTPSSQPLEGGGSPAVVLGGWAPSLAISSPATEIRRGPKGRWEREILTGCWSWAREPLGVWTRRGGKLL